jgi:membrane-associated protease RseP (regulator of RpoE activity)
MFEDARSPIQHTADEIEKAVGHLFAVRSVTLGIPGEPEAIRLRGHLQVPSDQAFPTIADRLRELGYTAHLRHDPEQNLDELLATPGVLPQAERPRLRIHALLLGATVLTTLYVGAGMLEARPPDDLWWPLFNFWKGWPFALSLLSILLAHELGHYFTSRRNGVPASLPYFVPLPIPDFLGNVLGTMGAVIVMKGRVTNRRVMLDIGSAGPLIGLIVAIPVLLIGLSLSQVQPLPVDQAYSMEGNSLLYLLLKYAIFGRWLPGGGEDVFIHPVAFAGWAGLLVTSFNLIPTGQLDGGHVLYSLLGERARLLTWPIILILAGLGLLVWPGWFLWAVAVMAVFVLTFTPMPLTFFFPAEPEGTVMQSTVILAGVLTGLGWLRRHVEARRCHG